MSRPVIDDVKNLLEHALYVVHHEDVPKSVAYQREYKLIVDLLLSELKKIELTNYYAFAVVAPEIEETR